MVTSYKPIYDQDENELVDMLFQNYENHVYNIALRYINDKHTAEDVVSEVFLKVIKYRTKFIDKSENDWLALLAIYTKTYCYNMYKYNAKHKTISIEDANISDIFSVNDKKYQSDPMEEAIKKEAKDALDKAIHKLTHKEQDILKLKYYFNAKNTEIADIFQMNESTVASTIANIKKKLKKHMEGTDIW